MRSMLLPLVGLLAITSLVWAQGNGQQPTFRPQQGKQPSFQPQGARPPQPKPEPLPKLDPRKSMIDWVLVNWEYSMGKVNSLVAECTQTSVDKIFRKKEISKGHAKYLRSGTISLASLKLTNAKRPTVYKKFIVTPTHLYEEVPELKVIKVIALPKQTQGQVADNSFLSFMFGMKAAQAKQRYHIRFAKQDKYYYYIDIQPKRSVDKVDFTRARLVLVKKTFMPRQLWFEEPNGNEVTWDFPRLQSPVPTLRALEFQKPRLPNGQWRYQNVNVQKQRKVIRNQR